MAKESSIIGVMLGHATEVVTLFRYQLTVEIKPV